MHKWIPVLLLFSMLTIGCSKDPNPEIEEVVHAFHAGFDAKDLQAMKALCTKDMFWYTLNGKALNASQISDYFTPMLERWQTLKTDLDTMEIRCEGGLAVARYQSTLSIIISGKPTTMQNMYTTVLVKQDGIWKIWQHQMATSY